MSKLIRREKELKVLEQAKESATSQFIAVYGRRRVGKTFLIREAFQQDFAFYLTGVANVNLQQNLSNFQRALQKHQPDEPSSIPENWFAAFGNWKSCYLKAIRKGK
ncbi:ATP-binding protein [Chitinophaga ginsengisoli]|uniref:Putative ATPase n=1 Tax=Chitinophaga ginsengisoli TaxID=363837 RepID=A0A2P8FUE3_9BACT|nr:ATP-binding protein [Chitinophaga ginsengisoli]PSL25342.1 putative ATPase [Chitinophaga ginsengisoli]